MQLSHLAVPGEGAYTKYVVWKLSLWRQSALIWGWHCFLSLTQFLVWIQWELINPCFTYPFASTSEI